MMRVMMAGLSILIVSACATTPAPAIRVEGPAIMRAVDVFGPDVDVAAFVRIVNPGAADRLVGVTCVCAQKVEIHNTFDSNMHVLPHPDLPAGVTTDIRPGGATHLMLMGMKQGYRAGDKVPITLTFASGAAVTVDFTGVDNSAEGWKAAGG
jgi:copper(I)-binding protein